MKKLIFGSVALAVACSPMTTPVDGGATAGGASGGGTATGGGSMAGGSTAGRMGGGASGGSGGGTGGSGGGSAGGNASGGVAGPVRSGNVTVVQQVFTGGGQTVYSGTVSASFREVPQANWVPCSIATEGPCRITDCTAAADAGTIPDAGAVSAGQLTVRYIDGGSLSLMPDIDGWYRANPQFKLFDPGTQVSISATGSTVPSFMTSLRAPGVLSLTMPACPNNNCGMVRKAAALNVAWTGGAGTGSANVAVLSGPLRVSCQFPASSGSGVIPAAALARLGTGAGTLLFGATEKADVDVGLFPVVVEIGQIFGAAASIVP